jgi:hypothetical protein
LPAPLAAEPAAREVYYAAVMRAVFALKSLSIEAVGPGFFLTQDDI